MKKHFRLISLLTAVALIAVVFTVAVSAVSTPDEAEIEDISVELLPPPVSVEAPVEAPDDISDEAVEEFNATVPEKTSETAPEEAPKAEAGILADDDLDITAMAHSYEEEKLLLVTVKNKTETAFSVDLIVYYLNAEGGVMGTEVQNFEQLAGGYEKNFVFRPGFDFADYRLETVKTLYSGECWEEDFSMRYAGMGESIGDYVVGDPTKADFELNGSFEGDKCTAHYLYPTYIGNNSGDKPLVATSVTVVIFDENGEIYDIFERGGEVLFCNTSEDNYKSFIGYAFVHGDEAAAAELAFISDNTTGFVAYTAILAEDSQWCK